MTSLANSQRDNVCPLAVVGMACHLPHAASEDAFWKMLIEGKANYSELSEDRLKQRLYFDSQKGVTGKTYSKIGAANDFRLLEADLRKINNVFQLEDLGFLLAHSVALEACRNAGYPVENFPHKNAGVFMGFTRGSSLGCDWTFAQNVDRVVRHLNELEHFAKLPHQKRSQYIERIVASLQEEYAKALQTDPNKNHPSLAARSIAAALELEGQAIVMDAACSSALSALALAARSLALGKIDAAIVGGVSYFSYDSLVLFSKAQSVSGTMSCPFDRRADGLICGEGHVFFVIKTLQKALEDGDQIRAVIRGIGVSSDGKGKSLWAPRKEGQVEAVRRAYRSGADPQRLQFVEGHMTSTPLGDLTEVSAINEAFQELLPQGKKILIGGVKANVGHTLEAAGLVGLAKAVLVLKHKTVPAQINVEKLNEQVDWTNIALKVPMEPTPLHPAEDGSPIQVSVNSFGIGGLNVHVVLEEFNADDSKKLPANKPPVQAAPVAVIGLGCLFPGANDVDAYWNLIRSGADPKTECPAADWDKMFFVPEGDKSESSLLGGYITNWEYDWKKHKIPPKQIAGANPLQFMILDAVDQALEHSGYRNKEIDRQRTSVVVGTAFISDFSCALQMGLQLPEIVDAVRKTLKEGGLEAPDIEKTVADYQKLILKRYPALLDETGSFTASTLASRITKSFDLMGGAVSVDAFLVSSMAALNTAVDMIRTGESSMVVCVGAQRATANIRYSCLRNDYLATNNLDPLDADADGYYPGEGVGVVILKPLEQAKADGDHIHAVIHDVSCIAGQDHIDASGQAIRSSLQKSALSGEDIALLETSCGISRKNRDRAISSWEQVLPRNDKKCSLGSIFAQIGHLGGASGMASLIKAILSMQHQESPEIFGTKNVPPSKFNRGSHKLEPRSDGRLFSIVLNTDAVGDDDYGVSYSVLLERGTRVEQAVRPSESVQTPYVIPSATPRLCAFMFPGQGSQYKGKLRALADVSEDCREILAGFEEKLRRLGYPTLGEMAWDESVELCKNVFHTQLSLLVADTVFSELLKRFGGNADMCFGHSYGEYPALIATGVWDFETAAQITRARCDAINALAAGTGMLSTDASVERLQEIFPTISTGRLYISNRNSQEQVVVSGDHTALSELDRILKQEKRFSLILPVPAGFHSPLVNAVREPLRNALRQAPIRFPAHPFLSSVSGRFEAEPETIRENLVEQMVQPVDFVALLQKAYKYGVRQFVETGPRTVLTNLARKIFAGYDDVEIIHCDLPKGTGEELLDHLRKTAKRTEPVSVDTKRTEPVSVETKRTEPVSVDTKRTEPVSVDTANQCGLTGAAAPGSVDFSDKVLTTKSKDLLEGLAFVEHCGTPYQIGYANGKHFRRELRGILHRYADIAGQHRFPLPDVSAAVENFERFFDEDTLQELQGLAEGAGVPLRPLLRHNLLAYQQTAPGTDGLSAVRTGQACVYFAGTLDSAGFVCGANVDVPLYRILPGPHCDLFQLRRPEGKIPHLLATGVGFLGGIFGINASGLCITTASLSEFPWDYSKSPGILPLFLLGRMLAEARTAEEAVELLKNVPRAGAWSFGISELNTGKIVHIEYNNDSISVQENVPYIIAANHQLGAGFQSDGAPPQHPAHSVARYERLKTLLNPHNRSLGCTAEAAFNALRDKTDLTLGRIPRHRTMNTLWRIDNIFSVLVDRNEGVLRLAATDITKTDSADDPRRHLTLPLAELLPELELIVTESKATIRKHQKTVLVPNTVSREEYIQRNTSKEGKNPNPSPTSFERHVLRLLETPVPDIASSMLHGAALIVADEENPVAVALSERLAQSGMRTFTVSPQQEPDELKNALERVWQTAPVSHIVFLSPHDPSAAMEIGGEYLTSRYALSSVTPLVLLREWVPLALRTSATSNSCAVLGATSLGGDFGIAHAPFAVESGAVSGLLKGLRMEFSLTKNPVRTKVIDHDQNDAPERIADDLYREIHHWDNDGEVGYLNGRRFVLRSLPSPLDNTRSATAPVGTKPVWLITGGARGITAAVATALGKRFQAKLHLVGSSPIPVIDKNWAAFSPEELKDLRKQVFQEAVARKEVPIKAWEKVEKAIEIVRNLQVLQDEKIDFTYHSCDMTDSDAVGQLLRKIVDEDRLITGIIHGAGFEAACRLEKKKIENVRRTMDVKVKGAVTLLEKLEAMKAVPEHFVGFSSVSGRFGGVGQTDYCMANDMLAKLLDWYAVRNPQCRSVCFHLPAWGEIGMAVRPESKLALEAAGLAFMPPSEGIQHLLDEIELGDGEREILITDWNYYKRFYPDGLSVPPVVEQKAAVKQDRVSDSRRFIIYGQNADGDALFNELTKQGAEVGFYTGGDKHETQKKGTLIVAAPRDPLGSCIFGVNHWKVRSAAPLRETLDICKNWLSVPDADNELILLTATDTADCTFFPEGVIVADALRTWFEKMNGASPEDALPTIRPTIRILDFAADASPKTVATETLRRLDSADSPGTFTANRWMDQWNNIDLDELVNVNAYDVKEIEKIHHAVCSEKVPGNWLVIVPSLESHREVGNVDDYLKTLLNETVRQGIKIHICTDSTFDPSALKDDDCMVYQRSGDTEADWADVLQQIRRNAPAMTGMILMACEPEDQSLKNHEKLFERIAKITDTAVTVASLTKRDGLQFTAVLPVFPNGKSLYDPAARSAAALLKTMVCRSVHTKVFFIRDSERSSLTPPEQTARAATLPLVDSVEKTDDHTFVARGRFNPVSDTFLLDHQLNGRPILPAVVTLECFLETVKMAKEALILKERCENISLENFTIHQGFTFRSKKSFDYYVAGKSGVSDEDTVLLAMYGDYYNAQGNHIRADKHYSSAIIRFDNMAKGSELNFTHGPEHCYDTWYPEKGILPVYHGPTFRCLGRMNYLSEYQVIAEVSVPDSMDLYAGRKISIERDADPCINAAVLDAALYACGILHWSIYRGVCIPSKMKRLLFGPGRLQKGETARAHIEKIGFDQTGQKSGAESKLAVFDFTIRDPRGAVVYDVQGYSATVLKLPQGESAKDDVRHPFAAVPK